MTSSTLDHVTLTVTYVASIPSAFLHLPSQLIFSLLAAHAMAWQLALGSQWLEYIAAYEVIFL